MKESDKPYMVCVHASTLPVHWCDSPEDFPEKFQAAVALLKAMDPPEFDRSGYNERKLSGVGILEIQFHRATPVQWRFFVYKEFLEAA